MGFGQSIPTTKRRRGFFITALIAITIILLCFVCNAFAYEPFLDQVDRYPDGGDFYPEDYFAINPDTILSSLDQSALNVFAPAQQIPEDFWPDGATPFQWHQSDFVKIAATLNQAAGED